MMMLVELAVGGATEETSGARVLRATLVTGTGRTDSKGDVETRIVVVVPADSTEVVAVDLLATLSITGAPVFPQSAEGEELST
jgi:hypothetical protein